MVTTNTASDVNDIKFSCKLSKTVGLGGVTLQNVISMQNVIILTQNVIKCSTQNITIFQRKL